MDKETVQELCRRSKLRLDEAQMTRAQEQITRLLRHFELLQQADTDDVEPSPYPMRIRHRPRPDQEEPPLAQEDVLSNAPAKRTGAFLVPRVVDG